MAISPLRVENAFDVCAFIRRIRNTEDVKGADVNFEDLVITGGSVEALQIDTCTGHVSSEFVEQRVPVCRLLEHFQASLPNNAWACLRISVSVPSLGDVVGVVVVPGITAVDKIYSQALVWFQTERTLVVEDQK